MARSLAEQVALGAMVAALRESTTAPAPAPPPSAESGSESPARYVRLSSAAAPSDSAASGTTAATDDTTIATTTTTTTEIAHGDSGATRDALILQDDALPAGWQKITHDSGLPCYVHEQLRLVCWSKPYVLDLMCSPDEFVHAAQQHVPPLSLFKAPRESRTRSESIELRSNGSSKKRKLRSTEHERPAALLPLPPASAKTQAPAKDQESEPLMTMDEFKTLPISDPRVLQVCMELSYKTPAQVLQEYQNRNRGISINYNTHAIDQDGVKLFKTIVSTGNSAAEGVASTKKAAKQLGAQALLAMLHERTAKTYYAVAELYSSVAKGHAAVSESSVQATLPPSAVAAATASAQAVRDSSYRRPLDSRSGRSNGANGSALSSVRGKKRERRTGPGAFSGRHGYAEYSGDVVGEYLDATAAEVGYAPSGSQWGPGGYATFYDPSGGSSSPWSNEHEVYASDLRGDDRERIVEYSNAAAGYDQQQQHEASYYRNSDPWGYASGYASYAPYAPPPLAASGYGPPPPLSTYRPASSPPTSYGPRPAQPPPRRSDSRYRPTRSQPSAPGAGDRSARSHQHQ